MSGAIVCVVAFLAVACSSGTPAASQSAGQGDPASLASSSTSSEPSTTVPAATAPYSFDPAPRSPSINNRGTDYPRIAASLLRFDDWVEANDPDPSLVSDVAAPDSTFDRALRNDVDVLHRLKRRLYEVQNGEDRISVVDTASNVVTLHDDQPLEAQRVVDANGIVTSEQKFKDPFTRYTVVIARMADGRWLIADIEPASS